MRKPTRAECLSQWLCLHQINGCVGAQSSLLHTLDSRLMRLQQHGTLRTPKGFDEAAEINNIVNP